MEAMKTLNKFLWVLWLAALPGLATCKTAHYAHPPITDAAEYQDAALLAKAWTLAAANGFSLEKVEYQINGAYCGVATAVNVMESFGQPADQETVLDGFSKRPASIRMGGMTLDQVGQLIRDKSGKKVEVIRDIAFGVFMGHVRRINEPGSRYTANFTRQPLFHCCGGHHSPLAAYLPDENLIFVLDVNEKYQSWLVSPERLYEAMNTIDNDGGLKRGLLRIE